MLSAEHNDILTRVGPGTPMGELMREYWIPACLPSELERDATPMRLKLLGEKLIAFRDSTGRLGILDHRCPHRCASMFFGRNEEGGVRCAYHGWKFDVEGNCLDQPNIPEDQRFTDRVKAKAYKVAEKGGIVWVYMGKRKVPPPLPALEVLSLPESERVVMCHMRDCNWLQSLEGDIDTSHFGFLHVGAVRAEDVDPGSMHRWGVLDRAPRYHVKETDWGTMYDAYRPAGLDNYFHRFAHFMFPFFALVPDGTFGNMIQATLSVPLDDSHTMTYVCAWSKRDIALRTLKDGSTIPGAALIRDFLPTTTDWLGRWRLKANRENDYLIDREEQARGLSFSGIQGIGQQDQAMVESMEGADEGIVDRGFENLAASDRMIAVTRRRLIAAAQAHQKDGTSPPTVDRPELTRGARGGSFIAAQSVDWLDAYAEELRKAQSPAGFLLQAAE
jgi:phenylpropionate dioxygenase-like ring-hydroxylating dioxygenase large terminal subunit